MKVLVLTPYLYDTVPGQRFRIEQWARWLEPKGVTCVFLPFETLALKEVLYAKRQFGRKLKELTHSVCRRVGQVSGINRSCDLIYLYRELLPIGPPILERLMERTGIPIVYDFDDAIFLPAASEANRRFRWLKQPRKTKTICQLSRHVIVGNAYLREYVRPYTPRVSVIPTTIDTERYAPKARVEIRGTPVIGWSGSLTTVEHLRSVELALKMLRGRHAFHLRVIGSAGVTLDGVDVESRGWNAASEIDDLTSFDVGVMPLPDDAWTRGKCGLKALQYMALGVPTVASPVGVNTEIIQDGVNGFLASTPGEWVEKLLRLLVDEGLRERFAREGRKTVERWYSSNVQGPRVLRMFEHICQGERVALPDEPPSDAVHERSGENTKPRAGITPVVAGNSR